MTSGPRDIDAAIIGPMHEAGVAQPAIDAFVSAVRRLRAGDQGLIPETSLQPVEQLLHFEDLPPADAADRELWQQLAIIKLNGGLGTGMGLAGPKSLLQVRGTDTFLDFIARQVLALRLSSGTQTPAFYLMNSFSTRDDSLQYLREGYPALINADGSLDFVQSRVPKLDPESLAPVTWSRKPSLAWCPPGHGDLYPSLLGNNHLLQRWLDAGIRVLFVSNADNLGATVDDRLLKHFVASGAAFLMEVARRTDMDRKGGHLARLASSGRFVLRELAQCPEEDLGQFQNVSRHRFFNTNNLWINLEHLQRVLTEEGGVLPLPLIRNIKPIDPTDESSPRVLQVESAMGAAIGCFEQATAIAVPRSRFAPVKTTSDLLAVRSNAYTTDECRTVLRLAEARRGQPPGINLDSRSYKIVHDFETLFPHGPPSLIDCECLSVEGPVQFPDGVVIEGQVEVVNSAAEVRELPTGIYRNQRIVL